MHSSRLPISRPPLIHVEALTKVFYGDEVEILSAPSGRNSETISPTTIPTSSKCTKNEVMGNLDACRTCSFRKCDFAGTLGQARYVGFVTMLPDTDGIIPLNF